MSATYDPMYDESDRDEERYYCSHGTFIGNPYGADYMCHFCELGYSDDEYRAHVAYMERQTRSRAMLAELFSHIGPATERLSDAPESFRMLSLAIVRHLAATFSGNVVL
jgi:hypothetical protein